MENIKLKDIIDYYDIYKENKIVINYMREKRYFEFQKRNKKNIITLIASFPDLSLEQFITKPLSHSLFFLERPELNPEIKKVCIYMSNNNIAIEHIKSFDVCINYKLPILDLIRYKSTYSLNREDLDHISTRVFVSNLEKLKSFSWITKEHLHSDLFKTLLDWINKDLLQKKWHINMKNVYLPNKLSLKDYLKTTNYNEIPESIKDLLSIWFNYYREFCSLAIPSFIHSLKKRAWMFVTDASWATFYVKSDAEQKTSLDLNNNAFWLLDNMSYYVILKIKKLISDWIAIDTINKHYIGIANVTIKQNFIVINLKEKISFEKDISIGKGRNAWRDGEYKDGKLYPKSWELYKWEETTSRINLSSAQQKQINEDGSFSFKAQNPVLDYLCKKANNIYNISS